MRLSRLALVSVVSLVAATACDQLTGLVVDTDAPANLSYQLIPSGDPNAPLGVLLSWDVPASGRANAFNVYGRVGAGDWQLRATTTSPTFHDAGAPETAYYVATRDANGNEIAQSSVVTIDLQARLPAPQGLSSISLSSAVHLAWSDNALSAARATFDHYRVYSAAYDGTRGVCTASWVLEGSTVSDAFLAGNLTNGQSRCFAVSAVTHDGHESVWSDAHLDTPRFDARNVFVYAHAARSDSAGFLFADDVTRNVGIVASAARTDLDFTVERHDDGSLWIVPARSGSTMTLYAPSPVIDLTAVDRAPSGGFSAAGSQALPGYAYVFRVQKADGVHFGALRVAFVTPTYVVFDWSYQSAPGNAELSRSP
jgi:hypothetical protein